MAELTERFDLDALRRGIVLAAVVAVPFGLLGAFLDEDSPVNALLSLAIMAGLITGAAHAAIVQKVGQPLTHGICAALGAMVIAQVIGLINRAATDQGFEGSRIISNILLTLIAGTIGGLIGSRRAARSAQ